MSHADNRPQPSTAQRLNATMPAVYAVIGPAARAVRRAARLALSAGEVSRFRALLRRHASDIPATNTSPRVVFDGCTFQDPHSGMARLWYFVLKQWSVSGFAANVLVLDRHRTSPRFDGFEYLVVPPLREPDSVSQRALLEDACRAHGADLFVSSRYSYPDKCRSLLYLYDMTPEVLGWNLRDPMWREKRLAIEHASAYLCLSESTATDLYRLYPSSLEKPWALALPGLDPFFRPAERTKIDDLRRRHDLPARYFMFLGHRDGYKNAQLLFDAVALVEGTPDFGLLLVGGALELEPAFAHAAAAASVPVRLARLSDDDLRAAYSGATALLYLSRNEGFGLPIVEAMACGCPVVTCRNSSLQEAAGDAALYVGEDDPRELLDAMSRASNPEARADLVKRGLARATEFSWSRTAAVVETAIRAAVS